MAAVDHSQALQDAVIAALLVAPRMTAVAGTRTYNEEPPPADDLIWPFNRVEMGLNLPTETSCWVGGEVAFTVHCFHRGPGRVGAAKMVRIVLATLDETTPELILDPDDPDPTPWVVELMATSSTVIADSDEPGGYHGVVEFTATTAEEA